MTEKLPSQPEKSHSRTMDRLLDPKRNTMVEQELFEQIKLDYSQPHRHYHTLEHLTQVVAFLDANYDKLDKPLVATWAAIYHDSVYDPYAAPCENERASAEKAAKSLSGKMYACDIERVERFIIATADHIADPNDYDMQLFLDADLSILGSPAYEYKKYASDIRAEYRWMGDKEFGKSRYEFLIGLLRRERIFTTETAHNSLEQQARRNILAELDYLGY